MISNITSMEPNVPASVVGHTVEDRSARLNGHAAAPVIVVPIIARWLVPQPIWPIRRRCERLPRALASARPLTPIRGDDRLRLVDITGRPTLVQAPDATPPD